MAVQRSGLLLLLACARTRASVPSSGGGAAPPAPLVCRGAAPQRPVFVATTWEETCECGGNLTNTVATGGCGCDLKPPAPPSANAYGETGWQRIENVTCWTYPNISPLGHISSELYRGPQLTPNDTNPPEWALNFGTWAANRTVPCTLDTPPQDGAWGNASNPFCGSLDPYTPGARDLPEGRRYLQADFLSLPGYSFVTDNPADEILPPTVELPDGRSISSSVCANWQPNDFSVFTGVWWDKGLALLQEQAELFFAAYRKAGGEIDELVSDWEQHGRGMLGFDNGLQDSEPCPASPANATAACFACLDAKWRAIQDDARFDSVWPQLESFGFRANRSEAEFLVKAMRKYRCVQGQPCTRGIQGAATDDMNKLAWNAFVIQRASEHFAAHLEQPMRAFFPHARMSSISNIQWDPSLCFAPDFSGWMMCRGGPADGSVGGATGLSIMSPVYYPDMYMCSWDCVEGKGYPAACGPTACESDGAGVAAALQQFQGVPSFPLSWFNVFKYVANHARQGMLAGLRTKAEFVPWISWRSYCVGCTTSHYWQEQILHMAVMGAPRFYLFSCFDECIYGARTLHEDYEYAAATLNQLDEVIGCAATERIWNVDSKPRWRDSFVLSGTDVGTERRAWRFTPDLAGSSEWNAAGQLVNGSVSMTPLDYVVPAAGTQRSGGGELTLHPVRFAINDTTVASDCSLSFPLGVVLPPTEHGALAPFGLWVIQPQRAGAPTVRCHGFPGVNEAWPPK